ncbi:MAG TPA: recombinase family protein [Isosphaeraceae bacterium]|jgi:DNA invertase Pin-like site-specific DNA recombinase|nr:recombinase family protein [Isosphaeraceae bacterium]
MSRVYGYVRVSTDKQALSPEGQRHTIEEAARRIGRSIDAWFQDAPVRNLDGSWNDAQSGKVPLHDRKAGREMGALLKRGDIVIVAKVDRAFRRLSDCVGMLDLWERQGVHVVLCDFPMISDLTNPFQKAMVQFVAIFAEMERKLISQRTREALALRKRKGHANGRYAGYGFRWERRWDRERGKHVKVRVEDADERLVMKEIARRRLDGQSWDAIRRHLCDSLKLVTKEGKPWNQARIVRAFRAELELQRREARSIDP